MVNTPANPPTFASARSNFQDWLCPRPSLFPCPGSRSYSHSPPCRSYLSPGRCSSALPPYATSLFPNSSHPVSRSLSHSLLVPRRCDLVHRRPRLHGVRRAERASISFRETGVCRSFLFHRRTQNRDGNARDGRGIERERMSCTPREFDDIDDHRDMLVMVIRRWSRFVPWFPVATLFQGESRLVADLSSSTSWTDFRHRARSSSCFDARQKIRSARLERHNPGLFYDFSSRFLCTVQRILRDSPLENVP